MTFRCRLASYLAAGSLALLALGNQALGSSPATAAQFAELRPSWPGARDGLPQNWMMGFFLQESLGNPDI